MLSKELDREAEQHAGHGQQDQRPEWNAVDFEETAWLLEELDALVVERDVCRREHRGTGTEQCRVKHHQVIAGLDLRLRFTARRDLHLRLLIRSILGRRVGVRARGIFGLVWHLLHPPNNSTFLHDCTTTLGWLSLDRVLIDSILTRRWEYIP